jgi:chorismate synthase
MSINAVKAVEIGAGFEAARLRGEDNADPGAGRRDHRRDLDRRADPGPRRLQADLVGRRSGGEGPPRSLRRHPRRPVVEAMVALVLADHKLLHRAQCG